MEIINTHKIVNDAIEKTEGILIDLKSVTIKQERSVLISFSKLSDPQKREKIYHTLKNLIGKYIYVITIDDWEMHVKHIKRTYDEFLPKNKLPESRSISRFNKNHHSQTLYVGSSGNIKTRIKQHLGDGNKRTYSLDLLHWFPSNINIRLEIYSINNERQEIVEMVEQAIWDHLKPLFGKRSGH